MQKAIRLRHIVTVLLTAGLMVVGYTSCSSHTTHSSPVGDLPFTLTNSSQVPLLRVNGLDVTREELVLLAADERTTVVDFFVRTYGAEIDEAFWQRDFSGDSPAKRLLRRTIHRAVGLKIQEKLSEELGLRAGVSYESFVAAWNAENARRSEAKERGEVIYGPEQYSLDAFFYQDIKSLELALIQRLNEDQAFQPYEGKFSFRANESRMQRMEKSFQAFMEDQFDEAEVLANETALESLPLGTSALPSR